MFSKKVVETFPPQHLSFVFGDIVFVRRVLGCFDREVRIDEDVVEKNAFAGAMREVNLWVFKVI